MSSLDTESDDLVNVKVSNRKSNFFTLHYISCLQKKILDSIDLSINVWTGFSMLSNKYEIRNRLPDFNPC